MNVLILKYNRFDFDKKAYMARFPELRFVHLVSLAFVALNYPHETRCTLPLKNML